MTAREIKLARSVFHDAIDYEKVRIHKRKWWWFQPRKITMAPGGRICTAALGVQLSNRPSCACASGWAAPAGSALSASSGANRCGRPCRRAAKRRRLE